MKPPVFINAARNDIKKTKKVCFIFLSQLTSNL